DQPAVFGVRRDSGQRDVVLDARQLELGHALGHVSIQGAAHPAAVEGEARGSLDELAERPERHDHLLFRMVCTVAAIASPIAPSGRTCCAAPSSTAARGMPYTTDVVASCANVVAWRSRIARSPSAPSRPIPLSTTPIALGPSADSERRSTDP